MAIGAYLHKVMAADAVSHSQAVLCVDLDGTLCRTDTLIEAILLLIKQQPLSLLLLPFWLLGGKARFKAEIAARVCFDAAALPYNEELSEWLCTEHAKGRRIALASGANEKIVAAVADHFGIFCSIVASDETVNRTGAAKPSIEGAVRRVRLYRQ